MKQLIFSILLTVAVVSFAIANSHHVMISFVVGLPIKIPFLIFLLLCTASVGIGMPVFYRMVSTVRQRRRLRRTAMEPKQLEPVDV